MDTYFGKEKRCAINVATAVANEIVNGYDMGHSIQRHSWSYMSHATLRGLSGGNGTPLAVSFDNGIWVKVHLLNLSLYDESFKEKDGIQPYQHLVVTHCELRYYPRTLDGVREDVKTEETWGFDRLTDLANVRPWSYPELADMKELVEKYPILASRFDAKLLDDIEESIYDGIEDNRVPFHAEGYV